MTRQAHLSDDTLAALVEGNLRGHEETSARDHLVRCRTCMAAYAEAVRFQSIWLDEPETLVPADEIVRLGLAISSTTQDRRVGDASRPAPRRRLAPLGLRPVALALGSIAVVLVAAVLWIRPGWLEPAPPGDRDLVARVVRAAEQASAHGMVLPFGDDFTVEDMTAYRAGGVESDAELKTAIQALIARYEQEQSSSRAACLLVAGQIAAGQIGNARVFVAEARRTRPDEPCLATLAAIIAFRENDLDRAESLLRQVVQRDPTDMVATFDLGLLLVERGRAAEAEPLLRAVQQARPRTPLGSRAAALLEEGTVR